MRDQHSQSIAERAQHGDNHFLVLDGDIALQYIF